MANAKREVLVSPSTTNGMQITCANTTGHDLDVNIVITKRLRLVLVLVEFGPGLGTKDLETSEGLWVRHCESVELIDKVNRTVLFEYEIWKKGNAQRRGRRGLSKTKK